MPIMLSFEANMVYRTSSFCGSFSDSMMRSHHQTVEPRHNKRHSGFLISLEAGQGRHSNIWRFENQD